ncbi:PEP-CTERM sorting domain-containing protein [Microcystis sp. M090S1]|uniref:PEP-CTERM sorting domain-containing protein n=1 Tax=Microcystis sp. M090S1 TaxID=2771135 RepID=UPI00258FE5BD|nr:PEP-CTERM sorting domain-containing protein [Microcystis sp. M090S1]
MTAELEKPYTEIEYMGVVYPIVALRGGHRGTSGRDISTTATSPTPGEVVAACQTNAPVYDPIEDKWTVPVTNSLIEFSTDTSLLGSLNIRSVPDTVNGYLEFVNNPSSIQDLDFPVNSIFTFQIELELPDLGLTLFSTKEVTVTANNLTSWPPPVGTIYYQNEFIDLVAKENGSTIATLRPDTTVVTSTETIPCIPEPSSILGLFAIGGLGLTQLRKKHQ